MRAIELTSFHIEEVGHEKIVHCTEFQQKTSLGKLVAKVCNYLHSFVEESAIYIVASKAEPPVHVSKLMRPIPLSMVTTSHTSI